ncbi:hypothetical protein [Erythrobacter sp. KY5]|uniref:hypothetical protein n=1 Tax=Erythrobacter sp. KY5 TaxID=2011159 RepID=UPI0013A6FEFF|nr:hypothetical protein [Erythrobacter sp. KY5]
MTQQIDPEQEDDDAAASMMGWYVTFAALAVFAILFNYNPMIGIAVGVLIAIVALAQLALSAWLASDTDKSELKSKPGAMVARVRRMASSPRLARLRELRLRSKR